MYSVGIDVSKGKSTVAIIDIVGILKEKVFEVQHNQAGILTCLSHLNLYNNHEIKIVMEATSHYHYPLLFALHKQGFFVCVESSGY